jgi:hypothetical protein
MEDNLQNNPISPFESMYWQAIYDFEGKEAQTQLNPETPFNTIDFDKLKSFCLYPLIGSPIQTALVVDYMPGYRLIFRREGQLNMVPNPNKPGVLVPAQVGYTYILGLVEDDGSDNLKLIERGMASPRLVDWRGGFRVILTPDGKLNAIGSYTIDQEERDIAGVTVQFIHFQIKLDV